LATLVDCTSYYFRELWLRMLFHDTVPPWEDATGGTPYQWTPTTFALTLHTDDPGESGDLDTNETAYTDYARLLYARGVSNWALSGAATANPLVSAGILAWPANGGGSEDIDAIGLGLRDGATDHPIARDVFTTVTIASGEEPQVPAGQFTVRFR
jgi:hypothetical protein